MARRPVFVPIFSGPRFVEQISVPLTWSPGFSSVQKQRNIAALHEGAKALGVAPVLEISTKGDTRLGKHLSAFHLMAVIAGRRIPLESAFQGSKIFEQGGPFHDLYGDDARTAKRDPRLRESGTIVGFDFDGFRFPSEPRTAFYDWLYVNALFEHREWLASRLGVYAGFSDIEFNPERSLNCQARSCALFVSLLSRKLLDQAVQSADAFLKLVQRAPVDAPNEADSMNGDLFPD